MLCKQAKILVVDDEEDILMVIKSRLEANNYSVITAQTGEEGLEKAIDHNPDLIILDLILPGMNGYEVCTRLKLDKIYDGPVIMLTARIRGIDVQLGYRCGASSYIPKPFFSDRLLGEVDRLLNVTTAA